MLISTIDSKTIETLQDIPDLIPAIRNNFEDWTFRVYDRKLNECKNYLSPNRRSFYKVLFISEGAGIFTLGLNTYYIDQPTILFIHPADIISWRKLPGEQGGHFCLFKRAFIENNPTLQSIMDKYGLFLDKGKSIVRLGDKEVILINSFFDRLYEKAGSQNNEDMDMDAIQAYMQLLLIESARIGNFPKPDAVTDEFRHVHNFFRLLEEETAHINYATPIKLRSVKEFAASLDLHPNHLNALLKKHTGQNVSVHIRNRLLEESKILLLQTNWNLQDIGYSIGFAEQPNFSYFFKKNTGVTPAEFRKGYTAN
jgi:AraC family transcriptional activator of pobA